MALASRTKIILEDLVREGSFKWLLGNRNFFDEEFEEMAKSASCQKNWISELSPLANRVVQRCSRVIDIPTNELQESFNATASDFIKHPSQYARNFLEYCCFRALVMLTDITGHLTDKKFRRLTYDMMLAWQTPASASQSILGIDEDPTVGVEAFSRIASAVPIISNVIISDNIFEVLTSSTGRRLQFSVYDKYLGGIERILKRLKTQSESSLLSSPRAVKREKILQVDGTVTMQPVLEHEGISTWPGRLTLTDHALYFEALRVVSYDNPKRYDLSDDLKQVVKPDLTGPWGIRLFDKAVLYKSTSLSEPVMFEFPELKGHARRDYWLAIIREILYVHRFIRKFQKTGIERDEVLSIAVLGILRLQAIHEIGLPLTVRCESLLMFSLSDQLPGGDLILETLASMLSSRQLDRAKDFNGGVGVYSVSALATVSNLVSVFGTSSDVSDGAGLVVGEIAVGEMGALERAVKESKSSYKKMEMAQATVNGVKVDGLDTNLAVLKELLFPVMELAKCFLSLAYWDDPVKSLVFCLAFTHIIYRGWLGYSLSLLITLVAVFMVLNRLCNQGRPVDELKVVRPPPMNTMEQLLTVQNAISQIEGLVQDGNIVLLKLRALVCSIFPQASEKFAVGLLLVALILAFVPPKYMLLISFLETFTRYSPPRKASTERWTRRIRDWWFSIPAAPVVLERERDEKKKR